jgi:tetratricopeptide (TPR) repeat protein
MTTNVRVWQEDVVIPTYGVGEPQKNPIFLEKRIYQGSSGAVYPHPVIEKIMDEKEDKVYHAWFLENEYLKIMILPELGGRIQMAFDKVKQRHFVYYQHVIKPALVGLTGPWISGGIEFNWPQHHRPSTFEPVDVTLESHPDGSQTVWCNEVERMFRTKGMAGFTLHPGRAYLEVRVKLYNRTPYPQTFLWWANPAVHVNDHYQSVFPPDVHAVFDHGKRDVSRFPIATGTYYKVDYSAGVDISRYKNIPVPTSFMAVSSKYDFVGGYEHDTQGGLLHVADHHVSPGKKQWTWGYGDFGQAWDRNLTDTDGPYIEIMCGVYTDNQPDFSWIMPYEEKAFSQYFMPYRDVGVVKNATKEAMINLEVEDRLITVRVCVTGIYKNAKIELRDRGAVLLNETADLSPERSFTKSFEVGTPIRQSNLLLRVADAHGRSLVSWQPEERRIVPPPEAATAALLPGEITENEQLYLTGLHLEQYRHATFDPTDYYQEALRRDPGDVRNNNAMGSWWMKRGQFVKAEPYFRRAVATLTRRDPNPYDGEPYYNLGLSLKMQGRTEEAYDVFYKAVWSGAWQDAGYYALAQIATGNGEWESALDLVSRSMARNWFNHRARHLKTAILRRMGRNAEAMALAKESLTYDPFNIGCLFEQYLAVQTESGPEAAAPLYAEMQRLMRGWVHNYIEYALDYASAGMFSEASQLLAACITDPDHVYPMVYYFLGYFASHSPDPGEAIGYYRKAASMDPDCCFPNRHEEIMALTDAMTHDPTDARAPFYLGNLWYAQRQYDEAQSCWERSASLNGNFPTVFRNLGLVYYNKRGEAGKALEAMERAFALDPTDARIFMELDQLHKKLGRPPAERLKLLDRHEDLVGTRDDLALERITLCNMVGQHARAHEFLSERIFHPWEGGEGKVTGQYLFSHIERAKAAITQHKFDEALDLLRAATHYPPNLGEGKLHGAQENDLHYYMGCAHEGRGDHTAALDYFARASGGSTEPDQAFFYNDQQPDKIFYRGMAWRKLGEETKARGCFNKLLAYGEAHVFDEVHIDYFAVSLPDLQIWDDDLKRRNTIHCTYLMGLGHLGLGNIAEASSALQDVLTMDVNHAGAMVHLAMARPS